MHETHTEKKIQVSGEKWGGLQVWEKVWFEVGLEGIEGGWLSKREGEFVSHGRANNRKRMRNKSGCLPPHSFHLVLHICLHSSVSTQSNTKERTWDKYPQDGSFTSDKAIQISQLHTFLVFLISWRKETFLKKISHFDDPRHFNSLIGFALQLLESNQLNHSDTASFSGLSHKQLNHLSVWWSWWVNRESTVTTALWRTHFFQTPHQLDGKQCAKLLTTPPLARTRNLKQHINRHVKIPAQVNLLYV